MSHRKATVKFEKFVNNELLSKRGKVLRKELEAFGKDGYLPGIISMMDLNPKLGPKSSAFLIFLGLYNEMMGVNHRNIFLTGSSIIDTFIGMKTEMSDKMVTYYADYIGKKMVEENTTAVNDYNDTRFMSFRTSFSMTIYHQDLKYTTPIRIIIMESYIADKLPIISLNYRKKGTDVGEDELRSYIFTPEKDLYKDNGDDYNLLVNLLTYLDVYSDRLYDGLPDNLSNRGSYMNIGKPSTITKHDDFICDKKGIAHIRSGHFKLLSSDYFVNKKGSMIYIKPTFVNGRIKTLSNNK